MNTNQSNNINPLLRSSQAPFGAPEFHLYSVEHYKEAFEKGIAEKRNEVNDIIENSETPTFANTIDALEQSGKLLEKVSLIFSALNESDGNDAMVEVENYILPLQTELNASVYMSDKLFARIRTLYDARESLSLSEEQAIVLEDYYQAFVRGGALLNEKEKARLVQIDTELGLAGVEFGKNLLNDNKRFKLIITDEKELAGLPQSSIDAAADAAKDENIDGWVITLDKPSCIPFLQYAHNRELRKQVYKAYYGRGDNDNANNNKSVIAKIFRLRQEKARLLGFESYAHFILDEKMAKTPEAALDLLMSIWAPAIEQAKAESAELQKIAGHKIEGWDWFYYTDKLRKEKYSLNDEDIKPYFKLDNVVAGAFDCAKKLYNVEFIKRNDIPVYYKGVNAYQVLDNEGKHLGIFYTDFFPRDSKRQGAWMTNFVNQHNICGENQRPFIVNVCNFTPPQGDTPALLNIDEVRTLFHEFGHALHGLLTQVHYPCVSGTNVKHDFVEMFSQINEKWAIHPEVLRTYAKHYITGDIIPDSLIEKMQRCSHFNSGFETTEIVAAALLDMKMHLLPHYTDFDCNEFENKLRAELGFIPEIEYRYRSTNFAHIFGWEYAVGYYSYLWAEVLDCDAFELFMERGIFDAETAASFKQLLEMGGSKDPMREYRRFRGAAPDPAALLRARGLL